MTQTASDRLAKGGNRNIKRVIVISGHAQNGKDTTACMLAEKLRGRGERVLIAHYADLVKYVCRTFFDWDGQKDEYGRQLLQYVGTDVVRTRYPDFWVDFIVRMLDLFFYDNWDVVIIPDTRFPNEIDRLREQGFNVDHLRIVRENFVSPLTEAQQRHPSETALDHVVPDHVIRNSGTLSELEAAVNEYIKETVYGD